MLQFTGFGIEFIQAVIGTYPDNPIKLFDDTRIIEVQIWLATVVEVEIIFAARLVKIKCRTAEERFPV